MRLDSTPCLLSLYVCFVVSSLRLFVTLLSPPGTNWLHSNIVMKCVKYVLTAFSPLAQNSASRWSCRILMGVKAQQGRRFILSVGDSGGTICGPHPRVRSHYLCAVGQPWSSLCSLQIQSFLLVLKP